MISLSHTIWILSIDPGTDGAAALIKLTPHGVTLWCVMSFKREANWEHKLWSWCHFYNPDRVVMERVATRPGQGVRSQGQFMDQRGAARTALRTAGREPELFQPTWWQSMCQLPKRREIFDDSKRRTAHRRDQKLLARVLFPETLGKWVDTKQGDVYGAVLIGYAAAMQELLAKAHS